MPINYTKLNLSVNAKTHKIALTIKFYFLVKIMPSITLDCVNNYTFLV